MLKERKIKRRKYEKRKKVIDLLFVGIFFTITYLLIIMCVCVAQDSLNLPVTVLPHQWLNLTSIYYK